MTRAHWPGCPVNDGLAQCKCAELELEIVDRATRPSPAELIRQARAKGLISGVYQYDQVKYKRQSSPFTA